MLIHLTAGLLVLSDLVMPAHCWLSLEDTGTDVASTDVFHRASDAHLDDCQRQTSAPCRRRYMRSRSTSAAAGSPPLTARAAAAMASALASSSSCFQQQDNHSRAG